MAGLDEMRDGNGQPLNPTLALRFEMMCARFDHVEKQIRLIEAHQIREIRAAASQ